MSHEVYLHPRVKKYLDSLDEREARKCVAALMRLKEDPFRRRVECDIKLLHGEKRRFLRLRIGKHRFEYSVIGK